MTISARPKSSRYQVAVIGFGPAGAVAAGLLGGHGLNTLAIDRQLDVYDKPRAIALDHEILRLFDNMGVAERVLPYVAPFPASQHFGAQGQLIRRIDMVPEPYPLGYTPTMVFTQPPVEAILREHAAALPSVAVELGTELVHLEPDADGVTLHLRNTRENRIERADYVIACDGASSGVRQQLGIGLDDLVFDEPWLVVDVLVDDDALAKLPQTAAQYCDPARPTSFIIGPGNHRRWEIMLLPGEDPQALEQPEQVWALLSKWLKPDQAVLWRSASYRFHALVAKEWRKGRVFLAGDAAHQQPPFIGQGMCQGLRDVSNLIWKLSAVIDGKAEDALLDTYGEERGEHVRQLTSRIKAIGHVICERDPEAARQRDARILAEGGGSPKTITRQEIVPPLHKGLIAAETSAGGTLFPQPWVETPEGWRLLDHVAGTGWRLVTSFGHAQEAKSTASERVSRLGLTAISVTPAASDPTGREGVLIERDGVLKRWFEEKQCVAAIVRPDHYVYGTASDSHSLETLLTKLERSLAGGPDSPRQPST